MRFAKADAPWALALSPRCLNKARPRNGWLVASTLGRGLEQDPKRTQDDEQSKELGQEERYGDGAAVWDGLRATSH